MSLRYKILAAVIGINVVILFATFTAVFLDSVDRAGVYREWRKTLLLDVQEWGLETWEARQRGTAAWSVPGIRVVATYGPSYPEPNHEGGVGTRGDFRESVNRIRTRVLEALRLDRPLLDIESGTVVIPNPDQRVELPARQEERQNQGLYIEVDLPAFRDPMQSVKTIYMAMMVGTVLLMVVTFVLVSRLILRPIDRLVRASNRIARGDYSEPVPSTRREDEIETLIEAFNAMMIEVASYRQHLEDRVGEATRKVKLAEKNLSVAQRLAATGKLASGIAHEVNNPLGGMINAARRLRTGDLSEERTEQYFEIIEDGLTRVRETVKKVLLFTPHRVRPQAVDLRNVLNRALGLAGHRIEKAGSEIRVVGPDEGLSVFGDPFELQQVFLNLTLNAVDALHDRGPVGRIEIVFEPHDEEEPGEIAVHISDNGCGMDEMEVTSAFDLFYTTKEAGAGTGLGLSIVHNIVTNHGGRIEVQSRKGEGTTFTVWLPRLAARE